MGYGPTVLIIDDDPAQCSLIRDLLTPAGYLVAQAGDVDEGWSMVQQLQPDLVLLDLLLPTGNGEAVLARIKGDPATAEIPVVILTQLEARDARLRCLRLGATDVLIKPIPHDELLARTRTCVDLRRARQDSRQAKGRLESLIEGIQEGIVLADRDQRILLLNALARDLLGLLPAEGHTLTDIHQAPHFPSGWLNCPAAAADLPRRQFNVILVKPLRLQIAVDVQKVINREGAQEGTVIFLRDRTREREFEDMKSEFITLASHELRTPIAALSNAARLLAGDKLGSLNDAQRGLVELIGRNTQRLAQLVSDILDLNRIEAGRLQLDCQSIDLNTQLQRLAETMALAAEPNRVNLCFEPAPGLPRICGDPARLDEIFINLLNNAMKFTPPGGSITLRTVNLEARPGSEALIRIEVQDTGQGIAPKHLPRIFDRFYQGDPSPSRQRGSGLGLAIVKELVIAHGGVISVESEVNRGTLVRVDLPVEHPGLRRNLLLQQVIENARRRMLPASLILLHVPGSDPFPGDLQQNLDQVIYRKDDHVLIEPDFREVVVALPGASGDAREAVARRVFDVLLAGNPELALTCGFATFPEHGGTAADLLGHARSTAQPMERNLHVVLAEVRE